MRRGGLTPNRSFLMPQAAPDGSVIVMTIEISTVIPADPVIEFETSEMFPSGSVTESVPVPEQRGVFSLIWWKNPDASNSGWVYVITSTPTAADIGAATEAQGALADSALQTVAHDATLTGLGTDASLLSVTNPSCQPVFRENPNHTTLFSDGSFSTYPEPLGKFPQFVMQDEDFIAPQGVWAQIFTPESLNNYKGYFTPLPDLGFAINGYPGVRLEMSVIGTIVQHNQNPNQGFAGFAIEDSNTISGSNNGLFVGFRVQWATASYSHHLVVYGMNSDGTIGSMISEVYVDEYPLSGDVVGFFIYTTQLYSYAVVDGVYKVTGWTDLLTHGLDTDSLAVSAYASQVETQSPWGFELHALSNQWNGVATAEIADHWTYPYPFRDLCGNTSVPILDEANVWTADNDFSLDVTTQGSISSDKALTTKEWVDGKVADSIAAFDPAPPTTTDKEWSNYQVYTTPSTGTIGTNLSDNGLYWGLSTWKWTEGVDLVQRCNVALVGWEDPTSDVRYNCNDDNIVFEVRLELTAPTSGPYLNLAEEGWVALVSLSGTNENSASARVGIWKDAGVETLRFIGEIYDGSGGTNIILPTTDITQIDSLSIEYRYGRAIGMCKVNGVVYSTGKLSAGSSTINSPLFRTDSNVLNTDMAVVLIANVRDWDITRGAQALDLSFNKQSTEASPP